MVKKEKKRQEKIARRDSKDPRGEDIQTNKVSRFLASEP